MTEQIGLDRLTAIIAFARAASLGSFTAAARSLSISPSAVSKSIQRLEERLGIKLFTRTTRSLTLTPEGHALYEKALNLLKEAEAIEQVALASRGEPSGVIKITCPQPIGINILAPHLSSFRKRYPQVTLDIRLYDTITDLVEEGIDVAIRVGATNDSRLIIKKLTAIKVCTFASPDYLKEYGIPLHPDQLAEHECINVRFQSSGKPLKWSFRVGNRILEILPDAKIIVDNSDAVAAIIANSGGIAISPAYVVAPYVKRGELVPILRQYCSEPRDLCALWPESRRNNPGVRAFVSFLTELFREPTPWDVTVFNE